MKITKFLDHGNLELYSIISHFTMFLTVASLQTPNYSYYFQILTGPLLLKSLSVITFPVCFSRLSLIIFLFALTCNNSCFLLLTVGYHIPGNFHEFRKFCSVTKFNFMKLLPCHTFDIAHVNHSRKYFSQIFILQYCTLGSFTKIFFTNFYFAKT